MRRKRREHSGGEIRSRDVLVSFRRPLCVITWFVLSVQMVVLTLGTVRVCVDGGAHTHGGVPAPDCAMHHALPPGTAAEHAHHGHATNSSDTDGPRIACRCSDEAPSTYLGQLAVIESHVVAAPYIQAVMVSMSAVPAVGRRFSPPAPPPR